MLSAVDTHILGFFDVRVVMQYQHRVNTNRRAGLRDMIKTKIIAAAVAVGLTVLANPAKAAWELNEHDIWLTEGTQTYTESPYFVEPSSAILCDEIFGFYLGISSVDIGVPEPENDGFQSTEISLRVRVDNEPTGMSKFHRDVQNGITYLEPQDPLFLTELQHGARSIQIEYPLASGRVIHTYSNGGIYNSPCKLR